VRENALTEHEITGAAPSIRNALFSECASDTVVPATWHQLRPTTAFYEAFGTSLGDSAVAAIQQDGEPGLLRFLASQSGVPARSPEPSRQIEVEVCCISSPRNN
jgi:hypothetical protein